MDDAIEPILLPALRRCLRQALHELACAEAHQRQQGRDPDVLLQHRLAPDMLALGHQVQVLADGVWGVLAQLRGDAAHPAAGRVFNRGEADLPPAPPGLTAAQALLRAALHEAEAPLDLAAWRGAAGRPVAVDRPGDARRFERDDFLWACVLPNLLFHAAMVHALLRSAGVPLGKDDLLGPPVFTRPAGAVR